MFLPPSRPSHHLAIKFRVNCTRKVLVCSIFFTPLSERKVVYIRWPIDGFLSFLNHHLLSSTFLSEKKSTKSATGHRINFEATDDIKLSCLPACLAEH